MYPRGSNVSELIGVRYDGAATRLVKHSFEGEMISRNHKRNSKGYYSEGGNWYMWKREVIHTPSEHLDVYVNANSSHYKGRFYIPYQYHTPWDPADSWDSIEHVKGIGASLAERGAEAWSSMRPDKPNFSLAQELMEMRELPGLFKGAVANVFRQSRREYFRKKGRRPLRLTGAAYLEYQFGWLPLLRSFRNFYSAFRTKDKRLRQLIRDEKKPVRRRRVLLDKAASSPEEESKTAVNNTTYNDGHSCPHHPILNTNCYANNGSRVTGRQTVTYKTWCEGRFRYVLPPGPRNRRWRRRMHSNIMGLRISAAELYAVFPWSWFVDYFVDLGRFIEATSPSALASRLICDYAYLMRSIEYDYLTEGRIRLNTKTGRQYANMSRFTRGVRKVRVAATPFGFGLRQDDLDDTQVAILGALGLSKLA